MKNSILNIQPLSTDLAALLLRLIFGGLFIYHGWGKLSNYETTLSMFTDIIGIGIKPTVILVIFAEFFCGIFVLLGFFTRLSVIPIFITMFVAYFIAHSKDPFQMKELALVYMLLSIVIFILGSGRYSLDAAFRRKR
jgi:putative oxidoreductase